MKINFTTRPHLFFLLLAAVTLIAGLIYWFNYPEDYLNLVGDAEFSIRSAYAWFIFSGYLLLLTGIYFTAVKGKLRIRGWLVATHFAFVLLFLVLFLAFNSFTSRSVQDRISGLPILTIISIYAFIFLLDLISLGVGLVMLLINILSFKRPRG